jgi:hypothetical protein
MTEFYRKSSENLGSSQQIGQPVDSPITEPRSPLEQPFAPTGPAKTVFVESPILSGVDVATFAVARFAHRTEVPEVIRATLASGEDVVTVHQNIETVLDTVEVDVDASTSVLRFEDCGTFDAAAIALATVDREDAHSSEALILGLDLGRADPIA